MKKGHIVLLLPEMNTLQTFSTRVVCTLLAVFSLDEHECLSSLLHACMYTSQTQYCSYSGSILDFLGYESAHAKLNGLQTRGSYAQALYIRLKNLSITQCKADTRRQYSIRSI